MKKNSLESGAVNKRLILLIVGGVLFFGIIFLTLLTSKGQDPTTDKTPDGAGYQFMDTVTKRDGTRSYAMFSEGYKETIDQKAWQTQLDFVFANYGKHKPKLISTAIVTKAADGSPKSQKLTYEIIFDKLGNTEDAKYEMSVTVVKAGEAWRVDEFSSTKK